MVDGCENDTSERVELEDSAQVRLASGLKANQGQWQYDPAVQFSFGGNLGSNGDHCCRDSNADGLQDQGEHNHPALLRSHVAMVPSEYKAAKAKEADGSEGPDPAVILSRCYNAGADVDGIARLHRHERSERVDTAAVEKSRDHVAGQQQQIGPVLAHILVEVGAEPVGDSRWLVILVQQVHRFLVGAAEQSARWWSGCWQARAVQRAIVRVGHGIGKCG